MPKHVLMSGIEIITDGGRRRRWTAAEKLRIVQETLDDRASISGPGPYAGFTAQYRDESGRIVTNWPGYMREYLQRTSRLDPAEFELVR